MSGLTTAMQMRNDGWRRLSRIRFDAAIFDLDGVITKTARVRAAACKRLFDDYLRTRAHGTRLATAPLLVEIHDFDDYLQTRAPGTEYEPFDCDADYRNHVDGKPRYEGVRAFLASRGIRLPQGHPSDSEESETICGLGNRKNRLFLEQLEKDGVEVYEDAVCLVERVRRHGLKTAIISSSKNCAAVLATARIGHLFDVRVDGIDAEALDLKGKPYPDILLEAASRLQAEPGRCVLFEDAVAGVQAGRAGNIGRVIGVDRAGLGEALSKAGADAVIRDLSPIELGVAIYEIPPAFALFTDLEQQLTERRAVVFLDYDGTLTPIVRRPEDAVLTSEMRDRVAELSKHCTVAVVSGRGLADVAERVGIDGIYYAGSHGFEIAGPGNVYETYAPAEDRLPVLDEVEAQLGKQLGTIAGAQLERKKFSIAVHYRNVEPRQTAAVEEAVDGALQRYSGLRKGTGKKVFEILPDVDWDKGRCVLRLLDWFNVDPSRTLAIYIGDDVTDEDAFRALERTGMGIVVGGDGERTTAAQCRLRDPEEVGSFLQRLTGVARETDTWALGYDGFEPAQEGLREALCTLGNGYFATRGAAPESTADGVHYPGTYLAGGYNRLQSAIAGRTLENEDLVNLPNWLSLRFRFLGQEWGDEEIVSQHLDLDIRRGVFYRQALLRDAEGRETRLRQRRIVSMANMHLAALETVITPVNWSGELGLRSALDGRVTNTGVPRYRQLNCRHLVPVDSQAVDGVLVVRTRTSQSALTIAEAARTGVFVGNEPVAGAPALGSEPNYVAHDFVVTAQQGTPITIEKIVALYTSRDSAIAECGLEALGAATHAERFENLLHAHCLAWKHLWRKFDVKLELKAVNESDDVHRALHLYSFHVLQSVSTHSLDIDVGLPSRGWHGEAYRGHVFWDEVITFPLLNYRFPQITRSLLMYRYRRLAQARQAARELGYRGAMFPWQSGSSGREESQRFHLNPRSGRWIQDNSHLQRHINAAIAYNVCQYCQVTGDTEFLASYGGEMILEIARFWASIATYDEASGRYEILGVMGPDEFHDAYPGSESPGLDNNAYTNLMAVFTLRHALQLFDVLHPADCTQLCEKLGVEDSEKRRWEDITRKMKIVFHDGDIISQFEGYGELQELDWDRYRERYGDIQRLDRILEAEGDSPNRYKLSKQADVLMLFYLFSSRQLADLFKQLGYTFEPRSIPRNIDYYLQRTSNGSSLSWVIHSWVAARRDRARGWKLFQEALNTDIADIQGGTTPEGIHLGAMSGCVDLVQRCFTGLGVREKALYLNPRLPVELRRIQMHLRYRGHWLELDVTPGRVRVDSMVGDAEPVNIVVQDRTFQIEGGHSRTVALRAGAADG